MCSYVPKCKSKAFCTLCSACHSLSNSSFFIILILIRLCEWNWQIERDEKYGWWVTEWWASCTPSVVLGFCHVRGSGFSNIDFLGVISPYFDKTFWNFTLSMFASSSGFISFSSQITCCQLYWAIFVDYWKGLKISASYCWSKILGVSFWTEKSAYQLLIPWELYSSLVFSTLFYFFYSGHTKIDRSTDRQKER